MFRKHAAKTELADDIYFFSRFQISVSPFSVNDPDKTGNCAVKGREESAADGSVATDVRTLDGKRGFQVSRESSVNPLSP